MYTSGFGAKAVAVAGRIADGYVGTSPERELLVAFDDAGGAGKPKLAGAKCCWHPDAAAARRLVHERWPNMGLPGELAQELSTPTHFEQAAQLVTEDMGAGSLPVGPDPEP